MELKQNFEKIMREAVHMALATSTGDQPNVRIVTFAYDNDRTGKVFLPPIRTMKKHENLIKTQK